PLPSRIRPSSRCSVSIEMLPSWLASYRAKKRTRLALSVYRSNIRPTCVIGLFGLAASHHRPHIDYTAYASCTFGRVHSGYRPEGARDGESAHDVRHAGLQG